ncbi:hypothetical protein QZH41_010019 [Actinostola sp. cb2023]|nr:hypothetical protein QZH41_010019 [Actinostola sp. cb2023]
MFIDHAVLNSMPVKDLRELCHRNGISSTGIRSALVQRLNGLTGVSPAIEPDSQEGQAVAVGTSQPGSQPSAVFTDGQIHVLKTLIERTVKETSRDIASEAARAAVDAIRSSNMATNILQEPADQASHAAQQITAPTSGIGITSLHTCTPSHDLPASYVRDIQSGEFFDLSKLLPKNLSLYNVNDDENLTLSLDNSVIKVVKRRATTAAITEIEQWTTAFTVYMSVFTVKYPLRAQELLQYVTLVRYAARVHTGMGWAIYDHKFRQKSGLDKSVLWSTIDQHLWLTIFTVAPSVLREEYPLFKQGPHSSVPSGGVKGTCHKFNRTGFCDKSSCQYRHTCSKCGGSHPECECGIQSNPRIRMGERIGIGPETTEAKNLALPAALSTVL